MDQWRHEIDRLGDPSVFRLTPDTEATALVYELLYMEFGQNAEFTEKLPKWRGWPLNPSAIYVRPLVKHGGDFYLFHVPLLERSALKLLEQIIKDADESYWQQSFLPKRDRYLENTALELLRNLLPGCRSISGALLRLR